MSELKYEMIAYTPEELIELAETELAWCEDEMKKAAREMGQGDDWRAALEHVKTLHVEPGKQPALIRDLAVEAIEYLDKHNLVTIPAALPRLVADDHDVARAPAREPLLPGRRDDQRLVPDQHACPTRPR